MAKIAILTFEGNPIEPECYSILEKSGHEVIIITRKNSSISPWRLIKWLFCNTQLFRRWAYDRFFCWGQRVLGIPYRPKQSWEQVAAAHPDRIHYIKEYNSAEDTDLLNELKPDLGIVIGTPVLKPDVFSIPRHGMINLHQGHIPDYQGIPPAYWEHRHGESQMHVTVHHVVRQLDIGGILEEKAINISKNFHFIQSKLQVNDISAAMLAASIEKALRGEAGEVRAPASKPNTVPSLPMLAVEFARVLLMSASRRLCHTRSSQLS